MPAGMAIWRSLRSCAASLLAYDAKRMDFIRRFFAAVWGNEGNWLDAGETYALAGCGELEALCPGGTS